MGTSVTASVCLSAYGISGFFFLFSFSPIQNWMKNSLKVHNESILEQVWNIFSEASSNVSLISL